MFDGVTSEWALSVWDAIKYCIELITYPFDVLRVIPFGIGDSTVFDFIIGLFIIGIAVFFFWRATVSDGFYSSGVKKGGDVKASNASSPHRNVSDYSTNKPRGVR